MNNSNNNAKNYGRKKKNVHSVDMRLSLTNKRVSVISVCTYNISLLCLNAVKSL